ELELMWPLLKYWPEDGLQTRPQLDGLLMLIEQHFEVDENQMNLKEGWGGAGLSLLYRPENRGVAAFTIPP
ncbi:MAG TPA: hypothetical protein VGE29_14035, partial [Prosthecobacter sp.]